MAKKGSGVLESRMAPGLLTDQLEFARKSDNSNSLKVKFEEYALQRSIILMIMLSRVWMEINSLFRVGISALWFHKHRFQIQIGFSKLE